MVVGRNVRCKVDDIARQGFELLSMGVLVREMSGQRLEVSDSLEGPDDFSGDPQVIRISTWSLGIGWLWAAAMDARRL